LVKNNSYPKFDKNSQIFTSHKHKELSIVDKIVQKIKKFYTQIEVLRNFKYFYSTAIRF